MIKSRKIISGKNPSVKEHSVSDRLGFMQGEVAVPDNFDQMGKDQITDLFEAVTIPTRGFHFNRKEANKR